MKIYSKFISRQISFFLIVFVLTLLLMFSLSFMLINNEKDSITFFIIFSIPTIFLIKTLMDFKKIEIDKETNVIKYYSIIFPLGRRSITTSSIEKTLFVNGLSGFKNYKLLYLINIKSFFSLRINSLYYKNFSSLTKSIDLEKDMLNLSFNEYIMFMYFDYIKLYFKSFISFKILIFEILKLVLVFLALLGLTSLFFRAII